jgi:sugar-specific transcriptional regulator TrmB
VANIDELVQRLQFLGFSQYEARAYCALLQRSPANGHEVAKTAGMPTSKVYETLERLLQKGAVLVQRSDPTLWAPVPYRDLTATLRQRMESNLTAVEQGLAQLGHEQDTKLTWSLSGHGHVVDSMRRAIDRTRERLAAAIPSGELEELTPALRAAAERGVVIDLVAGDAGDGAALDLSEGERVRVVRVRRRPDGGQGDDRLAVVLGDGEETVLADLGLARPEGMWTHHPAVALLAAEHLRDLA